MVSRCGFPLCLPCVALVAAWAAYKVVLLPVWLPVVASRCGFPLLLPCVALVAAWVAYKSCFAAQRGFPLWLPIVVSLGVAQSGPQLFAGGDRVKLAYFSVGVI